VLTFSYGAPVAQLDRASAYEAECRVFESPQAHHYLAMFLVYVLENETTLKHYTGYTSDLTQRVGQHNHGVTKSTKNRGTWKLISHEEFTTRAEAMAREKFLKSGRGRQELKELLLKKRL
jgi:putative endonuclease